MNGASSEDREKTLLDLATRANRSIRAADNTDPELPTLRESWDQLSLML